MMSTQNVLTQIEVLFRQQGTRGTSTSEQNFAEKKRDKLWCDRIYGGDPIDQKMNDEKTTYESEVYSYTEANTNHAQIKDQQRIRNHFTAN